MPKALHAKLARQAKKRGLKPGTKAWDRYVYGGMENIEKRRKAKKARKSSAATPKKRTRKKR